MTAGGAASMRVPVLRGDLELLPAPRAPDGSPVYIVNDPVSGQYSRLGWAEAEVIRRLRPGLTLAQLQAEIRRETPLRLSEGEIVSLLEQARQARYFHHAGEAGRAVRELLAEARLANPGPLRWVVRHYLFFRLPLVRPDAFLASTLRWVRPLATRPALLTYLLAGLLGLALLAGSVERYAATFTYFFNWQGALAFGVALTLVKLVHELAHAYTARARGVRIRTMGVAFIIFWPVPYTDVTDAWRLVSRRDRVLISLAGVLAELCLAGICLLGWSVAPPGVARSIFFFLSSLSLAGTLLVNLNPAMRFDGYYLLADLWNMDNLQPRAFALSKWWLRRWLLGVELPPPEEGVTRRRLAGLVAYSVYTWLYRIGLYTGIAAVLYAKFFKALGVVLFGYTVVMMLARPILAEARTLRRMKGHLRFNPRLAGTLLVLLGLLLWAALPLPRRARHPGLLHAAARQVVYAPEEGFLQQVHVRRDEEVAAGAPLARIVSPAAAVERRRLERELAILDLRLLETTGGAEDEGDLAELTEERIKVVAQLEGLAEEEAQRRLQAATAGTVVAWEESLRPGLPVAQYEKLGEVARLDRLFVTAFVPEQDRASVRRGGEVAFWPAGAVRPLAGEVVAVAPAPTDVSEYAALTSELGGDLPVRRADDGRLLLQEAYYRVEVRLETDKSGGFPGQSGFLELTTEPRSLLGEALRYLWSVAVRESGW